MDWIYWLIFPKTDIVLKPVLKFGPGDGTVDKVSLELCADRDKHHRAVRKVFPGLEHTEILRIDVFLVYLASLLPPPDSIMLLCISV